MPGVKILSRSSFKATPWKNGGGVTHEAIRVPPEGDPFSWRVSLARIDSAGPFSDFSGYQRKMMLVQGRGVTLSFGDGRRRELRAVGDWLEFDGAAAVHCDLLDGTCTDFNLIVSNALRASARLEQVETSLAVTAGEGETTLVFSPAAALELLDASGRSARLEPWDLAVITRATVRLEGVKSGDSAVPNAVFIATISQ